MTLQGSGPIGLSDINVELGYSPTAVITLNDVEVRALVGILSGAIALDDFYGASSATYLGVFQGGWDATIEYSSAKIVNESGTLVSTIITTKGSYGHGGAGINDRAIYYAGQYWDGKSGVLTNWKYYVDDTTFTDNGSIGLIRTGIAGAGIGSTAVFYAGYGTGGVFRDTATRLDYNANIIGSETQVTFAKGYLAGAGIEDTTAVFYAGQNVSNPFGMNTVTRINSSGTKIGSETSLGTPRRYVTGAGIGSTAIFYGGVAVSTTVYNIVTRINSSGTIIGSETNVGTNRWAPGGANVNQTAIFYGGYDQGTIYNIVTRINTSGSIVGSETSLTELRYGVAGAGINY